MHNNFFDEVERILPKLKNLSRILTRKEHSDLHQDLLQETVLRALEKQDQYKEGTHIYAWASKIMTRLFVNMKVQEQAMRRRDTHYHAMDSGPKVSHTSDLRFLMEDLDMATEIATVKLNKTPKWKVTTKEIMFMRHLEDMPFQEIAEQLNITHVTARRVYHYTIKEVRETLQEEYS